MKLFKKEDKPKKKHLSKRKKEKLRIKKKEEKLVLKEERKKNKKFDVAPFFGGIAVGIANIIPGVSGGTMLVIFNLFEKLNYSISDVFKRKTDTRKESIFFIVKVVIGMLIGIVGFAKILGFTLEHIEAETIFWFMGLILFSIPIIIKKELKEEKFNIIFFLIGIGLIAALEYFNLHGGLANTGDDGSLLSYLILLGLGIIGGAAMIFPGVSGSMVFLVLGKYEMVRGYVDKVTSLDIGIFIKLGVLALGAVLGIVIFAKLITSLLNKHRGKVVSLILGFIIASALILPLNLENEIVWTAEKTCGILASFTLGGIVIYFLNKLENKNSD